MPGHGPALRTPGVGPLRCFVAPPPPGAGQGLVSGPAQIPICDAATTPLGSRSRSGARYWRR